MQIKFEDYNLEDFLVKEGVFCGTYSKLIQPNHIGTKFTQKNKIFRSSIWSTDGELLSAGFFKFVNFGETPENFPVPTKIDGWSFIEKVDGSCCIIDLINNQISMRTRGTFSYDTAENKADFDACLSKYPSIVEWLKNHPHYSLLCEITTPNLKIVLNYGDVPDFWLIGAVNKLDYSLMPQSELDLLGKELNIPRPSRYIFSSIQDLLEKVDAWKGKEGVVAYHPNGQHLLKIKSDWYRNIHAAKENFRNIEAVIDVWFTFDKPDYNNFIKMLSEHYDYETMLICQGYISRICDAYKEVLKIVEGFNKFVENVLKPLPNRKEQALKTIASFGQTNRATFIFTLLDSRPLNDEQLKKLLYQCLKK